MEQQSISVAKSGVACQLRARCSIIAAQGWGPGGCGRGRTLKELSGLPEPLLSRFDLALLLQSESGNDLEIIEAILNTETEKSSGDLDVEQLKAMTKKEMK